MRLFLAYVSARKSGTKRDRMAMLVEEYVARSSRYIPTDTTAYGSESLLLAAAERQPGRPAARLVLLDPRGEMLTSESFARSLGLMRDEGCARVIFGIGPADGWSSTAIGTAHKVVSFGKMTLPHELARVVLAEQVYRALTILAGHPYHCGH